MLKVVPTIELRLDQDIAATAKDFLRWRAHTDTVCVLSQSQNDVQLRRLQQLFDKAGWRVNFWIGLKANGYLDGRLDNYAGWKRLGRDATIWAQHVGAIRVWLDFEGALAPYLGGAPVNWRELSRGVVYLPSGALIYPSVFGANLEWTRRQLCCDVLLSRLINPAVWSPRWLDPSWPGSASQASAKYWETLTGAESIPCLMIGPDAAGTHWEPGSLPSLLERIGREDQTVKHVIAYTGNAGFERMTAACVAALDAAKVTGTQKPAGDVRDGDGL